MKSYLTIAPGTRKEGQKTYTYCVFSLGSSVFLGIVKWKPTWRKYTFEPQPGTVFDAGCLREMADFLDQQTAMQKRKSGGGSKRFDAAVDRMIEITDKHLNRDG